MPPISTAAVSQARFGCRTVHAWSPARRAVRSSVAHDRFAAISNCSREPHISTSLRPSTLQVCRIPSAILHALPLIVQCCGPKVVSLGSEIWHPRLIHTQSDCFLTRLLGAADAWASTRQRGLRACGGPFRAHQDLSKSKFTHGKIPGHLGNIAKVAFNRNHSGSDIRMFGSM